MNGVQIRLKSRPVGLPSRADFERSDQPQRSPGKGEVLVRTLYISVDPALRPRMNAISEYAGALAIGDVIPASGLGVVIASRDDKFRSGDHVFGFLGWQSHAVLQANELRHIDPSRAPLPKWLSLLGLSSFTAYIGITELGRPRPGETVVVSAAAGGTGAMAGQFARIAGARVVGIAGGGEKCRHVVDNLGFDQCIDHRAPDFEARLSAACPDGIDVDYENVGGRILGTVYERMNIGGRVIICGLASEYHNDGWAAGPSLWPTVYKSLRIEGFRASRHFDRVPEFIEQALLLAEEGRLTHYEQIYRGLENAPAAFIDMLQGRHLGKAMVEL